jgi:hypothetical protein
LIWWPVPRCWLPVFTNTKVANGGDDVSETATQAQSDLKAYHELLALTERAQQGDKTTLPALRELFREPAVVDALGGDLAKQAQLTLISKYCGQNLLLKESLTRKLDLLHEELAGSSPTPLERLLVERIVACWLHVHHLETIYANNEHLSLELGGYYQRSVSAAQKRYLAAIKTLAVVRKLAVPVLQVNIAKKQVNVAGPCVAGSERETH